MHIEGFSNTFNSLFYPVQAGSNGINSPANLQSPITYAPAGMQGIIVEISQEAKNYSQKLEELQKTDGCQTCENRRYVDESSDSTVSYQTPAKIGPGEAASKVMAHEQEHVTNETLKAEQNDRKVVSHSVSLHTSICPECGKPYISGGTTRVLTASDNKTENTEQQSQDSSLQNSAAEE